MKYILIVFIIFLFNSLIYFVDATDFSTCTNKSLENDIPVVTFCKESTTDHVAIVLDGYYAHSNTEVTTCTCVARSQHGRKIEFSNPNFVTAAIQQQCASEIKVSNSKSAFIMSCTSQGSISVGGNGEIIIQLTKQQSTADTRYCIFVNQVSHVAKIILQTSTYVQATPTKRSLTTTYVAVSSTTDSDDIVLQTTAAMSDHTDLQTSTFSIKPSANDKSTNGLVVSTALGWCLCVVFAVTTIILLYQRRFFKKMAEEYNKSITYADLRARDITNYSTIGASNTVGQESE